MSYNWQKDDWPRFQYELEHLESSLQLYSMRIARLTGQMEALGNTTAIDIAITAMLEEALETSSIEGEVLNRQDVVSSIRKNLGLSSDAPPSRDQRAIGIAALLVEVRKSVGKPLTTEGLHGWHKLLMTGNRYVNAGSWRSDSAPMQILSGTIGKETVHFVAPPSIAVADEMNEFVRWFNATAPRQKNAIEFGPIRSAIAHLYFESIHPYEDGNGRIGRAIAEKALFQDASMPLPLSLSRSIQSNRQAYYEALQEAQSSNHITPWLEYFLSVILDAQQAAGEQVKFAIRRMKFFDKHENHLNPRQKKAIIRMFEQGPAGFEGGMNAKKYMSITKASKATATRDLQDLLSKGAFRKNPGGSRSTSYSLVY